MGEEETDDGDGDEIYQSDVDKIKRKLLKNMSITSAARFNAAQRFESRSRSVNLMLALLASSVIILSVLPMTHTFDEFTELAIFLAGLIGSVFVVVLSLYQWSSRDEVNAEKFHQAGMKISALRRDMELAMTSSSIDTEEYFSSYTELLKECGANHEDIDFIRVRLDKSDHYEGRNMLFVYHHILIIVHKVPSLAMLSFIVLCGMITVATVAFIQAGNDLEQEQFERAADAVAK